MDTYASPFALGSPKAIHLLPGEHGEIWGRLDVGWEKMALWSTKAAISLKCVKIEKSLLWGAYRNSSSLFRTVPSPTPYGLPFPKIGGSHPSSSSSSYRICNAPFVAVRMLFVGAGKQLRQQNSNRYYLG